MSDEEDHGGHHVEYDYDCKPDLEPKHRINSKPVLPKYGNSSNSDTDDDNKDEDYQEKKAKRVYQKNSSKPGGQCKKCMLDLPTLAELIDHIKECNPDQLSEIPYRLIPKKDRDARKPPLNKIRKYKEFSCSFCARIFTQPKALERHELLHQTDPNNKRLKVELVMFFWQYFKMDWKG